jgi:hypothetical protein
MTARFLSFIPFILKWETVYKKDGTVVVERDPDDPGGTTKYGIDQRAHPHVDVENLTKDGAIAIYWSEWQREEIEGMSAGLGETYYNCAVNCGTGRAHTIGMDARSARAFIASQRGFYERLVKAKPKFKKYLAGWLNRLDALEHWLHLS